MKQYFKFSRIFLFSVHSCVFFQQGAYNQLAYLLTHVRIAIYCYFLSILTSKCRLNFLTLGKGTQNKINVKAFLDKECPHFYRLSLTKKKVHIFMYFYFGTSVACLAPSFFYAQR